MEIAVKNLTKSFKGIKILNNVNITFKSKKIIALVGRNGSGKSVCFVDSIIFALFGKTLKNTNNQYIPNRNCDISLKSIPPPISP